jgi:hypothetical protein
MYESGDPPMVGDVVEGSRGRGEVLEVTHLFGQEAARVQWTTPRLHYSNSKHGSFFGIFGRNRPSISASVL